MPPYLGDRIRDARKAAGLTQRQLAEKINVSNTSISNWEKGQSNPDPDTIQHLCWALDVEPNFFFKGSTQYKLVPISEEGRNILRLAGRDGYFKEKVLSDEQMAALRTIIEGMPDAPDDI